MKNEKGGGLGRMEVVQTCALSILTLIALGTLIAVVSVTSQAAPGHQPTAGKKGWNKNVGNGGAHAELVGATKFGSNTGAFAKLLERLVRAPVDLPPKFELPGDISQGLKPLISIADHQNATTGELQKSGHAFDANNRMFWSFIHPTTPRIFYLHNTLSKKSCDEMIKYAENKIERSHVIALDKAEQNEENPVRTSSGTFLVEPEIWVKDWNMELRNAVGAAVGIPDDWMEATQVLKYSGGQFYRPHTDFFEPADTVNMNRGGQRFATVLTWLNDVSEGGSTSFPLAKPAPLSIAPNLGDSVLFYSTDEHMNVDITSTHGGEPPEKGHVKWVAVLWCHPRRFT